MDSLHISQLPVPQMEPLAQLAPYLNSLNVNDALISFNQLADALLHPTGAELNSSQPASPGESVTSSSLAGSSSSWSSSCSVSSEDWSSNSPSDEHYRKKARKFSSRRSTNASAAERYRKKVKGQVTSLAEQVEREQSRNARLRCDIEMKLALYREFVDLLAQNTRPSDVDLARLGHKSLANVLAIARDACGELKLNRELEARCETFRLIANSSLADFHATGAEPESRLVYDFYSDSFVDSYAD